MLNTFDTGGASSSPGSAALLLVHALTPAEGVLLCDCCAQADVVCEEWEHCSLTPSLCYPCRGWAGLLPQRHAGPDACSLEVSLVHVCLVWPLSLLQGLQAACCHGSSPLSCVSFCTDAACCHSCLQDASPRERALTQAQAACAHPHCCQKKEETGDLHASAHSAQAGCPPTGHWWTPCAVRALQAPAARCAGCLSPAAAAVGSISGACRAGNAREGGWGC